MIWLTTGAHPQETKCCFCDQTAGNVWEAGGIHQNEFGKVEAGTAAHCDSPLYQQPHR